MAVCVPYCILYSCNIVVPSSSSLHRTTRRSIRLRGAWRSTNAVHEQLKLYASAPHSCMSCMRRHARIYAADDHRSPQLPQPTSRRTADLPYRDRISAISRPHLGHRAGATRRPEARPGSATHSAWRRQGWRRPFTGAAAIHRGSRGGPGVGAPAHSSRRRPAGSVNLAHSHLARSALAVDQLARV